MCVYKIEFVDYLGNFDYMLVKAESKEKLIKDFKRKNKYLEIIYVKLIWIKERDIYENKLW